MPTLTWPDYLIVKSVDTINQVESVSSESRNKKVITRTIDGQRFDFNMRTDIAPWDVKKASGFLFALQDDDTLVEYTDVDWIGTASNTTANGAYSSGERDITLTNVANLNAGDWVNFGGHNKLYKILFITGSEIRINTGLKSSVSDLESVELESPKVLLELAPDLKNSAVFSSKLHRQLSSINLRFIEAL